MSFLKFLVDFSKESSIDSSKNCLYVRQTYDRFLSDLVRVDKDADFPYYFDEGEAERVCKFTEMMKHIKGPLAQKGECIKLVPFQKFFLANIFGWKHKETNERRFTDSYTELARGNAKSTLSSAVLLYAFIMTKSEGSEVATAASGRAQARITFDICQAMLRKVPSLCKKYGIVIRANEILIPATNSKLFPCSAEAKSLEGLNLGPVFLVDECHVTNRDVVEVLQSGSAKRECLGMYITTAGTDKLGVAYDLRDYVLKVNSGALVNERWFGMVYTIDEGDNWEDPDILIKANPLLNEAIQKDVLENMQAKAVAQPSARTNFKIKHLNIWMQSMNAYFDMHKYEQCINKDLDFDYHMENSRLFMGLDLASKRDIAVKIYLFEHMVKEKKKYAVFGKYYLPQNAIDTSKNADVYRGWVAKNYLDVSFTEMTDYDQIEEEIVLDSVEAQHLIEIAFDPWNATMLVNHLDEHGLPLTEFGNTVKNMSEPMKQVDALIHQGDIEFEDNPVLRWMFSNVEAKMDRKDNVFPNKSSDHNKIDGAVALIMAMGQAMYHQDEEPEPVSNYTADQGFTFI